MVCYPILPGTVSSARLNVAVNQNAAHFYYFTRQDIDLIYGGLFDEGKTQVQRHSLTNGGDTRTVLICQVPRHIHAGRVCRHWLTCFYGWKRHTAIQVYRDTHRTIRYTIRIILIAIRSDTQLRQAKQCSRHLCEAMQYMSGANHNG